MNKIEYHGTGSILFKEEKKEDFAKKFDEFTEKLKPIRWNSDDKGLYQIILYCYSATIDDCESILKENLDCIEKAQINFNCADENECKEQSFPVSVNMEVAKGIFSREDTKIEKIKEKN